MVTVRVKEEYGYRLIIGKASATGTKESRVAVARLPSRDASAVARRVHLAPELKTNSQSNFQITWDTICVSRYDSIAVVYGMKAVGFRDEVHSPSKLPSQNISAYIRPGDAIFIHVHSKLSRFHHQAYISIFLPELGIPRYEVRLIPLLQASY
ncbi:hypothetical protein CPC08DRAFT_729282 [Agrocybe pediades]|nr:hypothetical protein CPC08DRAFT_729282 [Agrocybe pediades]